MAVLYAFDCLVPQASLALLLAGWVVPLVLVLRPYFVELIEPMQAGAAWWLAAVRSFVLMDQPSAPVNAYWSKRARNEDRLSTVTPHKRAAAVIY